MVQNDPIPCHPELVSGSYFVALVQYLNCTKDPEMNSGWHV